MEEPERVADASSSHLAFVFGVGYGQGVGHANGLGVGQSNGQGVG